MQMMRNMRLYIYISNFS